MPRRSCKVACARESSTRWAMNSFYQQFKLTSKLCQDGHNGLGSRLGFVLGGPGPSEAVQEGKGLPRWGQSSGVFVITENRNALPPAFGLIFETPWPSRASWPKPALSNFRSLFLGGLPSPWGRSSTLSQPMLEGYWLPVGLFLLSVLEPVQCT
jgi:hypothetical protein